MNRGRPPNVRKNSRVNIVIGAQPTAIAHTNLINLISKLGFCSLSEIYNCTYASYHNLKP